MNNYNVIYIYALTEPDTQAIRYVGKTVNLTLRYNSHLADTDNTHKAHWIQSLVATGRKPGIIVLETLLNPTNEEWSNSEKFWITFCREQGCSLTNIREGGQCGLFNATTLAKMSVAQKGNTNAKTCLNARQVLEIRIKYATGQFRQLDLANEYEVEQPQIGRIIRGERWGWVGGPIVNPGRGKNVATRINPQAELKRKKLLESL